MPYKTDQSFKSLSIGEVIANSITHGIGFGLSIAGLVVLIVRAVRSGSPWHLASFLVFGISLILMYLASTTYHIFSRKPWMAVLQRLDHAAIFFLIAGTYTPFILTHMRTGLGWTVFSVMWGISLLGLIFKLVFPARFTKPPVLLYLFISWAGLIVFGQTFREFGSQTVTFLLIGGAFYTSGILFYLWKKIPYSHAVWHLFVLGGSIFHYFSVLNLA